MMQCVICGKETEELCPDGVCRDCHVSVSFEDCCDGTWNAKMALRDGVPFELVKKIHPNARVTKDG